MDVSKTGMSSPTVPSEEPPVAPVLFSKCTISTTVDGDRRLSCVEDGAIEVSGFAAKLLLMLTLVAFITFAEELSAKLAEEGTDVAVGLEASEIAVVVFDKLGLALVVDDSVVVEVVLDFSIFNVFFSLFFSKSKDSLRSASFGCGSGSNVVVMISFPFPFPSLVAASLVLPMVSLGSELYVCVSESISVPKCRFSTSSGFSDVRLIVSSGLNGGNL